MPEAPAGTGVSDSEKADSYIARLERLPAWGLSYVLVWALGFSWFVTLYDAVGNVGPGLPYMLAQGFFPGTSSQALNEALFGTVTIALVGYPVGAISLSYLADRIGRRPVMIASVILTAVGELGMALSPNYIVWDIFRFVAGCGIGADLALVITYLSEMSPSAKRGTFVNNTYIAGWIGAGFGALIATQIVIHDPTTGWRIAQGLGATLGFMAFAIRSTAPESLRYLAKAGRFDKAEALVSRMEQVSMSRAHLKSLPEPTIISFPLADQNPLRALLKAEYIKRLLVLFVFWFFEYWVTYPVNLSFTAYFTSEFHYSPSQTTFTIALVGYLAVGATAGAILVRPFLNRFDRRVLATLAAASTPIGLFVAFLGGPSHNFLLISAGLLLRLVIGASFVPQLMYLISAESFPTASRSTGYSLTDGLGHLGGAVGGLVLLPLTALVGAQYAFPIMAIPLVIAGLLVVAFVPRTVGRKLEEVNEVILGASPQVKTPASHLSPEDSAPS